jgi:hypothetical protein
LFIGAYENKIPLSFEKYNDLIKTLDSIPPRFHDYYINLPHVGSSKKAESTSAITGRGRGGRGRGRGRGGRGRGRGGRRNEETRDNEDAQYLDNIEDDVVSICPLEELLHEERIRTGEIDDQ